MPHLEPDTLALLALGEVVLDPDQAAHLAGCAECAEEVDSLRRVVDVARSVTPDDLPGEVPPQVWDRVQADLGLERHPAPIPLPVRPPRPDPRPEHPDQPRPAARRAGRRWTAGWVAGAAAAGLVLGGLGGTWWTSRQAAESPVPGPSVLAEATLEPLPGWDAAGVAVVETDGSGERVIVVDVEGTLGDEGYREVWLIAPDLSGMVSLGLLDGAQGRFVLPEGLDLSRYPVVDVSEEPFDGDATHSGDSIVRGTLDA